MWWVSAVRNYHQPPWIMPDGLWERIEPLLPVVRRRADHPRRKPLDDQQSAVRHLVRAVHRDRVELLLQELGRSPQSCRRVPGSAREPGSGVWLDHASASVRRSRVDLLLRLRAASADLIRLPASGAEGKVAWTYLSPQVTGRRLVSFLVSYMFVYLRPSPSTVGR